MSIETLSSTMDSTTYFDERKSCPICPSLEFNVLKSCKFEVIDGIVDFNKYDISLCTQCGMIFANNIPSQSTFDNYYRVASKYESKNTEPIAVAYYSFIADCISETCEISHKIIDLGCGYGDVLRELKKRNFRNLKGVDPSSPNIDALTQIQVDGICDSLFNLNTKTLSRQDCVIFTAVLEHIVDIRSIMKTLSDLTQDNGVVFVIVPDAEQFLATAKDPYREFNVEHINYFDIGTLTLLFAQYSMIFKKQWEFPGVITAAFTRTPRVKNCIVEYVKKCDQRIDKLLIKVEKFIVSKEPILIWGSGSLTQYLLANTSLKNCNIVAFVDSNTNYHGSNLFDRQIISPNSLQDEKYRHIPIIISTYAHSTQIKNAIENELCIDNEIVIL